jgi:hypothetical protein
MKAGILSRPFFTVPAADTNNKALDKKFDRYDNRL